MLIGMCAEVTTCCKGRIGRVAVRDSSRGKEVKNYKELVSINAISPAVSASWQL